jgi:hypothetical protein
MGTKVDKKSDKKVTKPSKVDRKADKKVVPVVKPVSAKEVLAKAAVRMIFGMTRIRRLISWV